MSQNESVTANLVAAAAKDKAVDILLDEIEKLKQQKIELEERLQLDQVQRSDLKEPEIAFFLTQFAKGDTDDLRNL